MLTTLDSDLWTAESPLRFAGLEIGARMTVVRLSGGRLLLHSPIPASDALVRAISAVGVVAFLVAPNRLHHLFAADWMRACPRAALYVAPGLETKRPDLPTTGVLGHDPEPGWSDAVDQVLVEGIPFTNEVVFFHRSSTTLIVSDLAFNFGERSPLLTRAFSRLVRIHGRLSPTFLERLLVRDRVAFRRSLERIFEWPFERVVVAHGDVKQSGGREELLRGYDWVFERGRRR